MTTEERFERLEHVVAGLADERRKEREEYRQLWRDSQRQIGELGARTNELAVRIADTNDAVSRLADETRVADLRLSSRIDSLVSAVGELIRKQNGHQD